MKTPLASIRRPLLITALILAASLTIATETAPLPPAATRPGGSILPEKFAILRTRNPFSPGGKGGGAASVEAGLVFKGAVRAGDTFTAFVADPTGKEVLQLNVGDVLAHGRVKAIDLDVLDYEADGQVRHIAMGQNLEGMLVPPASRPSPPPTAMTQPGPPMPPGAAPEAPMPGGPAPAAAPTGEDGSVQNGPSQ